jgi:hypothetical protein
MFKRMIPAALAVALAGSLVVSIGQTYRCTTATGPITLDGVADEATWADADSVALSLYMQAISNDDDITQQEMISILQRWRNKPVYVKMLWDSSALYVHFYGTQTQVWNELSGRDVAGYYNENAFELFLDPRSDGTDVIELNVSTRGDITDILNFAMWTPDYGFDLEGIEAATRVDEGTFCPDIGNTACNQDQDQGWSLEMKIPFSQSFTMTELASPHGPYWEDTLTEMQKSMPPAITMEGVRDWNRIAEIIRTGEPAVVATMLSGRLDQATLTSIENGTLDETVKSAIITALNGMVTDMGLFPDNAGEIAMRDTAYGLSPVSTKARGDREFTVDFGGTVDVAYPLDDTSATVKWANDKKNRAEIETTFVEGCSVVDTVVRTYPDTVIMAADGIAGTYHQRLVNAGVLLHDEATGAYSLKSPLEAADSIDVAWFNLGLIEGLLLPAAVAQLDTIAAGLVQPIDIMGTDPIPPADGDEWRMNAYYMASPPCSLYGVTFAFANVNETGDNPHNYEQFGTIAFAGTPPEGSSARPDASSSHAAGGFRAVRRNDGRITVRYDISTTASRGSLELFSPSGALVRSVPVASAAGRHTAVLDARTVGAGTYIVRLNLDGSAVAGRRIVIR